SDVCSSDLAKALIQEAKDLLKKYEEEGIEIPKAPVTESKGEIASDAKSQADQMLKQQMAQLAADEKDSAAMDAATDSDEDTVVEEDTEIIEDANGEDEN